jgi:DNA-directed RNA polymerase subunit RPC12/RpoP
MCAPFILSLFDENRLTAKRRFLFRPVINWSVAVLSFIVAATIFALLLPEPFAWLADFAAIALWYYVLFHVARYRTIRLRCPHARCFKPIDGDTQWKCGNCGIVNKDTDRFPFINRCQHCGFIPKAYKCHHCGEMVFLTEDRQALNYATCANYRLPASPDERADKGHERTKTQKQRELEIAQLEGDIAEKKRRYEIPKIKTIQEQIEAEMDSDYARIMGAREHARKLHERIDVEHKNDPQMREKAHQTVNDILRKKGIVI